MPRPRTQKRDIVEGQNLIGASGRWSIRCCDLSKLDEWLEEIPGTTSEIVVPRSKILTWGLSLQPSVCNNRES